jgi:carbohydrate-selective porin OprB
MAKLPLGTVHLKNGDYVTTARTFGLVGSATLSTLTMSGSSLTITLGTPSSTAPTAAAAINMKWTPTVGTTDLAGNAAATTITPKSTTTATSSQAGLVDKRRSEAVNARPRLVWVRP